jgi:hypothetical protein
LRSIGGRGAAAQIRRYDRDSSRIEGIRNL